MRWIKNVYHPERLTVTTAVHIPYLGGYWEQCLEVLKLCLQSLYENTRIPFELMVFDNGSCNEVQDYLLETRRKGVIQYLISSEHNLGKAGAWNILFQAAPGKVISYTDSDVYFLPGWLEASLKILEVFPEAGMVTAQPIPGDLSGDRFTLEEVRKNPSISIKEGRDLIPQKYVDAHRKSLGEAPDVYAHRIKHRKEVLVSRGSVSAYVSASHFQFTTTKEVLRRLFPTKTIIPLGDDMFEVEKIGRWRLSTTEYLVHHMGNKLPSLQDELEWLKIDHIIHKDRPDQKSLYRNRILRSSFVRYILKRLNAFTYDLLYYRR